MGLLEQGDVNLQFKFANEAPDCEDGNYFWWYIYLDQVLHTTIARGLLTEEG